MDIVISIFQSILFIYIINYCLEKDKLVDSIIVVLCIMLLTINGFVIPYEFGNFSICVFISHVLSMIIIVLFFRKKYVETLVSYSLIYSIVAIWIFTFGNILYGVLKDIVSADYIKLLNSTLIYMSQVFLFILCFKFKDKIKQIYKLLINEGTSIYNIIMISFIPDFFISLYFISYELDDLLFSKIVIIALFIFLGVNVIYFGKIAKKANKIYKLNKILDIKNNELKNIKNSYGIQMLYLYQLCNTEKFDDIASLLKNIINTNQNSANIAGKSIQDYSLLSLATKHVRSDDINVVIEDNANFKLTVISELELYRVIVNIVNNAIKAMKNKGTLIVKSYEDLNNIIIKIENDGEKIPEEIIDKIFDSGFTTKKNNNKNHGYGLNIVKELIEYNHGKIFVDSNDVKTKFTIALPIKGAI